MEITAATARLAMQNPIEPHPFDILSNSIVPVVWIDSHDKKQWFFG